MLLLVCVYVHLVCANKGNRKTDHLRSEEDLTWMWIWIDVRAIPLRNTDVDRIISYVDTTKTEKFQWDKWTLWFTYAFVPVQIFHNMLFYTFSFDEFNFLHQSSTSNIASPPPPDLYISCFSTKIKHATVRWTCVDFFAAALVVWLVPLNKMERRRRDESKRSEMVRWSMRTICAFIAFLHTYFDYYKTWAEFWFELR